MTLLTAEQEVHPSLFDLVDTALEEDIQGGDITTRACITQDVTLYCRIILKESGVIAGLPLFMYAFQKDQPDIDFTPLVEEGSYHKTGKVIATLSGKAYSIMSRERTALNLIQHASGIATRTAQYVHLVNNFSCQILDTRRTLPGLRCLEQYAIRLGGGHPHRKSLDERFIIKRHHINLVGRSTSNPVKEAMQRARAANPTLPLEIEVHDLISLETAIDEGADLIYLNKMHPDMIRRCVQIAKRAQVPVYIECPSMITLETIRDYAETGANGMVIQDLALAPPLEVRLFKSL